MYIFESEQVHPITTAVTTKELKYELHENMLQVDTLTGKQDS